MTAHQVNTHDRDQAISVQPMTCMEYARFRGWVHTEGEDLTDPGYLLRHGFHTSWWPAAMVDMAFVTLPPAPPHQQQKQRHVHAEYVQLRVRQEDLIKFLKSDQFSTLVPAEQIRLSKQYNLQKQLLEVLSQRITAD